MKRLALAIAFILIITALFPLSSCSDNTKPKESVETTTDGAGRESTDTDNPNMYGDVQLFEYEMTDDGAVITLCRLLAENLEVPSELDGNPVVGISDGVFRGIEEMKSATIPEGVKYIGASAFEKCINLETVSIPDSVEVIEERAFRDTPWLEAQKDEFTVVGDGVAIKYSGDQTDVTLPDNVKYLSDAFASSREVVSVTLNDGVRAISAHAFSGLMNLESVSIPDSVTEIGNSAFSYCTSLKEITVPESVTSLGEFAFNNCSSLETATLNCSVKAINIGVFAKCESLKSVVFPEGLETVENAVFEKCTSLESVNFPSSVTSVSGGAFDEGTNVTVTVAAGSYAENFCRDRNIKYEVK